jgi:hypothetical protein
MSAKKNFLDLPEDEQTAEIARLIKACAKDLSLSPQDVTWNDFKKYTKYQFGKSEEKILPTHITRVGGFAAIRDSFFPPDFTKYGVERLELKGRAKQNRKLSEEVHRNGLLVKQIEHISSNVFKDKIVPSGYAKKNSSAIKERHLNLLLSDLHIRALLDDSKGLAKFGPVEEARRLAAVCLQAATYKPQYREKTQLNLHLLGDIIQGDLGHDPRDGAELSEQICAAQYLLAQAVGYLSAHFPKVVVRCAPGNHDRMITRHKGRAIHDKWDSYSTVIYHAVKMACASLKNVEVIINKKPWIEYESFGIKAFGTHGDTIMNMGYPAKKVDISSIEGQVNRLNASLPDAKEYKLVFAGHVHTGSLTWMPNGTAAITNGALIPTDDYGLSIGCFESFCGQTMWESVPGHIVGDYRFIHVNKKDDMDASLDKIIKPFTHF